jgi:hypothetical protein
MGVLFNMQPDVVPVSAGDRETVTYLPFREYRSATFVISIVGAALLATSIIWKFAVPPPPFTSQVGPAVPQIQATKPLPRALGFENDLDNHTPDPTPKPAQRAVPQPGVPNPASGSSARPDPANKSNSSKPRSDKSKNPKTAQ